MLDQEKDVQGVTVYAEFRREGSTMMMFITPDGYLADGRRVNATLFRRVLTRHTPKRQWRSSPLGTRAVEAQAGPEAVNLDDPAVARRVADGRLGFGTSLFAGLITGGWSLVKAPILVETSKTDLADVAAYKTPTKLVYRINQSREALAFPTALY